MKHSKLQRKYLNSMRGLADVPWPARRYKYPPTAARLATRQVEVGTCDRPVDEVKTRVKRFRRKQTVAVPCGGRLIAKLGKLGTRRVYCENCRARKRQRRLEQRIRLQTQSRFGHVERNQREERRSTRLLAKFRRTGAR